MRIRGTTTSPQPICAPAERDADWIVESQPKRLVAEIEQELG